MNATRDENDDAQRKPEGIVDMQVAQLDSDAPGSSEVAMVRASGIQAHGWQTAASIDVADAIRQLAATAGEPDADDEPVRPFALSAAAALMCTRAERAVVYQWNDAGEPHVVATRFKDRDGELHGLLGIDLALVRAVLTRGAELFATRHPPSVGSPSADDRTRHWDTLCVPVSLRAEVVGALYIDGSLSGRPLDDSVPAWARAIATVLAATLLARVTHPIGERWSPTPSPALQRPTNEPLGDGHSHAHTAAPSRHSVGEVPRIVGRSAAIRRVRAAIRRLAPFDVSVLIHGETGTGKELVAHAIHAESRRRDRAFVAISCGAISASIFATDPLVAERGPYTSAVASTLSLISTADGGTLFLDEVGDLPRPMQIALLRALETGEVWPSGHSGAHRVDARVIAATHQDLERLVADDEFRADLLYRLDVARIDLPPLRAYLDDLPFLSERLLEEAHERLGLPRCHLSPEALDALMCRAWMGNVRELRHVLATATIVARSGVITPDDLSRERVTPTRRPFGGILDGQAVQRAAIIDALQMTAGHRGRAATILGVSRSTLYRHLDFYGIDAKTFSATGRGGRR